MFEIIRFILLLIVSGIAYFMIKRSKIIKKKLVIVLSVILCIVIISFSGIFPIENLFFSFRSPESVFYYTNTGIIDEVIYGQDSCMIVYSKGNSTGGHYIIPKTAKGYKIPDYYATKKVIHRFDSQGSFYILNLNNSNDFYIYGVTVTKTENFNIVDSNNKKINNLIINNRGSTTKTVILYGFIENFTNGYYISIDGEKILLNNDNTKV